MLTHADPLTIAINGAKRARAENVCVSIPRGLAAWLRAEAARRGISVSGLVTACVSVAADESAAAPVAQASAPAPPVPPVPPALLLAPTPALSGRLVRRRRAAVVDAAAVIDAMALVDATPAADPTAAPVPSGLTTVG